MTKPPFALDYRSCSLDELKGFAKAQCLRLEERSLEDAELYIAMLGKADLDMTFRFQDLPGELRNPIYWELLVFQEAGQSHVHHKGNVGTCCLPGCFPQILATSSVIRQEANSILYGMNPVNVLVDTDDGRISHIMCINVVPYALSEQSNLVWDRTTPTPLGPTSRERA